MNLGVGDFEKGSAVDSHLAADDQAVGHGHHHPDWVDDSHAQLAFFHRFNRWMEKMGGETRGIERVPEDERFDDSYWNSASMWLGGNLVIAAFSLGGIGITIFGLAFWDSVLVIIFFSLLGSALVGYLSTFGPPTGMRQMVLSRYWFGFQGVRIAALINCLAAVGWGAVNTMASANVLNQINHGALPNWAGILIIAFASLGISLFGYKVVHYYEKFAWIPNFAVFLVIASRMGMSKKFTFGHMGSGSVEAANCLSFGTAIFGFAAGWSPYASDYTAYKPSDTNRLKCFLWVFIGEAIPVMFACILGAAVSTGTIGDPHWAEVSEEYSTGGLLRLVLVDDSLHKFGEFCMIVLSLSTIANNIPNLYTFALSAQSITSWFRYIPHYIWVVICTGISIAIAIPGISSFESFLSDFMNIIGYWVAFYGGIGCAEHFVYRRGMKGYNLKVYNDPRKMGVGYSAIFAGGCGIMGAVLGMAQPWYVGVISRKIGDPKYGGDIGFILAFSFAFVALALTRWLEIRFDGGWSYPKLHPEEDDDVADSQHNLGKGAGIGFDSASGGDSASVV